MPEATDISDEVRKKLDEATQLQIEILARELVATYLAGYKKAGADAVLTDLQRDAIAAYTKEQTGYIAEYNKAIGDQIEKKIKEDIGKGMTYDQIKRDISPYIEEVFTTGTVMIDRRGETREVVHVGPDGKLYRETKEITQPYSVTIETYSEMLARTTKHSAYTRGRSAGYAALGITKWRYIAMNDERTRPEHLSQSGNVFEIGSDEESMALDLMSEPNCRCRQIPFFDDSNKHRLSKPESMIKINRLAMQYLNPAIMPILK